MEGLEDAWPHLHFFLHTHGNPTSFIFAKLVAFNLLISFFLLNNLSVTSNAMKEPIMHNLYFGCLATGLLVFS